MFCRTDKCDVRLFPNKTNIADSFVHLRLLFVCPQAPGHEDMFSLHLFSCFPFDLEVLYPHKHPQLFCCRASLWCVWGSEWCGMLISRCFSVIELVQTCVLNTIGLLNSTDGHFFGLRTSLYVYIIRVRDLER